MGIAWKIVGGADDKGLRAFIEGLRRLARLEVRVLIYLLDHSQLAI
jgi:hypothetical protein